MSHDSHVIPIAATSRAIAGRDSAVHLDSIQVHTQDVLLDSNSWILTLSRGAYTGARTVNGTHVLDFSGHLNRTSTSLGKIDVSAEAAVIDQTVLAALTNPSKLAILMRPVVSQALASFYKVNPSYSPKLSARAASVQPNETKITWLAGIDGTLAVHCSPLSPPGPRDNSATRAIIAGEPRGNAQAKDSQWVADRKPLSRLMADGSVNEVLLAHEGKLYEGLSSNFFVVLPATANSASDDPIHRFQVHTAPLTDVLTGTILRLVLEVCGELGVSVQFCHPQLSEASQWSAAFVTSTSRLVCPLARIDVATSAGCVTIGHADHGLPDGWSVTLDPQNPLLVAISDRVRNKLTEKAEKVLDTDM